VLSVRAKGETAAVGRAVDIPSRIPATETENGHREPDRS
jgi:hypothetical protein